MSKLDDLNLCMRDNRGTPVNRPIPHMQSTNNIREMIRRGYDTAACFAELKARAERVRAGRQVIAQANARGEI